MWACELHWRSPNPTMHMWQCGWLDSLMQKCLSHCMSGAHTWQHDYERPKPRPRTPNHCPKTIPNALKGERCTLCRRESMPFSPWLSYAEVAAAWRLHPQLSAELL